MCFYKREEFSGVCVEMERIEETCIGVKKWTFKTLMEIYAIISKFLPVWLIIRIPMLKGYEIFSSVANEEICGS